MLKICPCYLSTHKKQQIGCSEFVHKLVQTRKNFCHKFFLVVLLTTKLQQRRHKYVRCCYVWNLFQSNKQFWLCFLIFPKWCCLSNSCLHKNGTFGGRGAANRYNYFEKLKIMWYTFMKPTLCSSYCGSLFHSVAMFVTFHKKRCFCHLLAGE